jgi:hypothetical protein
LVLPIQVSHSAVVMCVCLCVCCWVQVALYFLFLASLTDNTIKASQSSFFYFWTMFIFLLLLITHVKIKPWTMNWFCIMICQGQVHCQCDVLASNLKPAFQIEVQVQVALNLNWHDHDLLALTLVSSSYHKKISRFSYDSHGIEISSSLTHCQPEWLRLFKLTHSQAVCSDPSPI